MLICAPKNDYYEQRRKIMARFLLESGLSKQYSVSHYKTIYMFIRYNCKQQFDEWLKENNLEGEFNERKLFSI